jgi:hypothetical protein
MSKIMEIEVATHYFKVKCLTPRASALCLSFSKKFLLMGMIREPRARPRMGAIRVFAAANNSRDAFRFHINSFIQFKEFLIKNYVLDTYYTISNIPLYTPIKIKAPIRAGWAARDYQVPAIEYILHKKLPTHLLALQTGRGKGATSLMSISEIGERVVGIMKPAYIEKWCDEILQILDVKPSDIMTVSGGDQLRGLIDMAIEGELNAKFIVVSNKTYQNYISKYEEVGDDLDLLGYGCTPDKFFETLRAGVRLIDEVHQDAHLNFKIDLYSNVPRAISLSATLISNDAFLNEMYDLLCHTADRFREAFIDKYIDSYAVFYKFSDDAKLRSTEFGSTNYSHHAFEKSIIKDPRLLYLFLVLINDMLIVGYLKNYQQGDKIRVFASSIDMCTRITDYLKRTHRNLDVRRYVEDDPYENIIDADIGVTTIQSGGTAIDIPGLTCTILTVAVSSIVSNKQTLGRLRKIPGRDVSFYYLVCQNIPKHIDYHYARKQMLLENARHFKEIFYKDVLV